MNDEQTALLKELVEQIKELRKELTLKHSEPMNPTPWQPTPVPYTPYWPGYPYWTQPYTWC